MEVKEAIKVRRAYRALEQVRVPDELIVDLARHAGLAPSCFNKQPWRFVFARDKAVLERLFSAMSRGNEWTRGASMVVAVFSRRDLDCVVGEREYYQFDTGIATAFMILRATELGLVTHPLAGFDEAKMKDILNIPGEMKLITLLVLGKKAGQPGPLLSEKQSASEDKRPPRIEFDQFAFIDSYSPGGEKAHG